MKIEKLNIENYRTIEKLEISLDSYYTAISGRNNSGKSNILRVLRFILGDNSKMYSNKFTPQFIIVKSTNEDC